MSSLPLTPSSKLPPDILEVAARWYVQLHDEAVAVADRKAWQNWLDADIQHKQAWGQLQMLERRLGLVPGDIAVSTFSGVKAQRRRVVSLLTILLGVGAGGFASYEMLPWQSWSADIRTRTGERRRIQLADGGTLDLNTASAVDIKYSENLRLLRLRAGEALIQTAPDPALRPFEVHTAQGSVRALGTRFSVRSDGDLTHVAVFEHAVNINPVAGSGALRLEAGQQAVFSNSRVNDVAPLKAGQAEWVHGRLMAIDQRLGDFIAELSRHRSGYLGCDPAVADLRISGAFRLADIDAVLLNLTASLPVRVTYATRYWTCIEPI